MCVTFPPVGGACRALIVSVIVAVRQQSAGNSTSWWNRLMDALELTASDDHLRQEVGWLFLNELAASPLRSREDRHIVVGLPALITEVTTDGEHPGSPLGSTSSTEEDMP
ncbi:hypothetical protein [Corynebacterium nuruki]|uniref:hypothetical protein n=1 Tax=Corynebacterium nuruki TaxID=1032851 RepID=UPI0011127C0D|nr:hypothetical protein [Corynebacterium nuruki]